MKSKSIVYSLLVFVALLPILAVAQENKGVAVWLTTPDKSSLFALQPTRLRFSKAQSGLPTITVNGKQRFQTIDGFGFAVTGGSAQLLMQMGSRQRSALLHQLFSTEGNGIGVSYIRVSIGSSDMNAHVYSYDDLPAGETDPDMKKFSLAPDRVNVIPVLKEILAIDPRIKILGSPWSAPAWMKTNDDVRGGFLKPECYGTYAKYFVKYIQGMKAEGIRINAVTVQNEPLNPKNTPSMAMFSKQEDNFIKNDLGPAFQRAGIQTKILVYDHNPDVTSYALSILGDPAASKYVAGSAWHLYGGEVCALTKLHDAYPNKKIYFTEQSISQRPGDTIDIAVPVSRVPIGATRNWARNVLLWNLAADPNSGPHTNNGGCTGCRGAITLDGNHVRLNVAYYVIAHFSKFVRPGSVRVGSNKIEQLANAAFLTPQGKMVLIVANTGNFPMGVNIRYRGKTITTSVASGDVATFVW